MSRVLRRPAARQDLVEIAYRYLAQGNPAAARRFRDEAEAMSRRLATMPGLGTRYEAEAGAFGEIRFAPLPSRFRNFLVSYRPVEDGVEIVRVLHGARDLPGILGEEFGVGEDDG